MPEEIIHKMVQPIPKEGPLHDVILCWMLSRPSRRLRNVSYSTNINHVNCPECWDLWRSGIYA